MERYVGTLVAIALFLLAHLATAIWFGAKVSARVDMLSEDMKSATDAIKSIAAQDVRLAVLEQRMLTVENDARASRAPRS
jgi:cell division protein FtsB